MDSFRFYSWYWFGLGSCGVCSASGFTRENRIGPRLFIRASPTSRGLPVTLMQRVNRCLPALLAAGLCLMIVGLARPQSGKSESRISGEGIAIELVLDVSGSMEALDFQLNDKDVSRLEAVKHVVSEFIAGSRRSGLAGRRNDLVGLVAFCGFADSKCPLTLDHGALVEIVKSLEMPKAIRDRRGKVINQDTLQEELATAIGDGVALGIDRLKDTKVQKQSARSADRWRQQRRSDRSSRSGCDRQGTRNQTVHHRDRSQWHRTVSAGRRVWTSRSGVAQFRMDEALLKEMGESTGASYFHASDADGLAKVYAQIDQLERSEFEESKFSQYTELFRWFSGAGLAIVLSCLCNEGDKVSFATLAKVAMVPIGN